MRRKILLPVLLTTMISIVGFAQQDSTLTLSLNEAQQFAIENNLSLKNAKLDIESAEKVVWQTTAIGLPQVNGNLNYQHIPGVLPEFSFGADSSTAMFYSYIFSSLSNLGEPPSTDLMDALTSEGEPLTLGVKNSMTYSFRNMNFLNSTTHLRAYHRIIFSFYFSICYYVMVKSFRVHFFNSNRD